MKFTGQSLTLMEIIALRSIDRRGDTMEVHSARERVLVDRGLIKRLRGWRAELTDDGADILASLDGEADK